MIRRQDAGVGLFSLINIAVGAIAYAEENGCIPVIDMQNYPNIYLDNDDIGRVNVWEYYLEQPGGITLEQALSSRKYILSRDPVLIYHPEKDRKQFQSEPEKLTKWRNLYKKYLRFKPNVTQRLNDMLSKYADKKILGVLVRGTDYAYLRPKNHPIPPSPEQAIAKAQEVMLEKGFDAIYLATEDKRIAAKFKEAFGEKLILPECDYVNYDYDNPQRLANFRVDRENDKYLRGLEYLVSMLFLSRCKGFITSLTSGSTGVMCLSEGFDYLYVFDLGVYP